MLVVGIAQDERNVEDQKSTSTATVVHPVCEFQLLLSLHHYDSLSKDFKVLGKHKFWFAASNSHLNAVARQVHRGQEQYRGTSAPTQASSPPVRTVRNHSGSSVRDLGATQAPQRPTQLTPDRGTQFYTCSPHARETTLEHRGQQRRFVNFGDEIRTSGRPGYIRVGEGHTRSPSGTQSGDGR